MSATNLPTTLLSLGQIQGEFNGVNPVSMSEYYRGGQSALSYVGPGTPKSSVDSSLIAQSGALRMGMFRGTGKGLMPTGAALITKISATGGAGSECGFNLQPDGSIWLTGDRTVASTYWRTPLTAAVGAGFYCRLRKLSGSSPSTGSSLNTIMLMNTARSWAMYDDFLSGMYELTISEYSSMSWYNSLSTFEFSLV